MRLSASHPDVRHGRLAQCLDRSRRAALRSTPPTVRRIIIARALASAAVIVCIGLAPFGAHAGPPAYKLGLDLPLSGIDGASALPARNAVLLAIDAANRAGFLGGARIALSDLDDAVQGKHDPAQGALNLRSFVGDPDVLAVVGPMNSNVAKAEIPISNAAGLALITMAATSIELTRGPNARKLRATHPQRPAFFRVCASDDRQGAAAARFARARGLRRAFIIDDNESYGRGLADVFAKAFLSEHGIVLGREHLTSFALDYKALLTKIRATAPDAIFFGGIVSTGGAVLRRQMADVGLAGITYLGGDGLASPEYVPLAGHAAENTYFTLIAPDVERLPEARAFRTAYRTRYHSAGELQRGGVCRGRKSRLRQFAKRSAPIATPPLGIPC